MCRLLDALEIRPAGGGVLHITVQDALDNRPDTPIDTVHPGLDPAHGEVGVRDCGCAQSTATCTGVHGAAQMRLARQSGKRRPCPVRQPAVPKDGRRPQRAGRLETSRKPRVRCTRASTMATGASNGRP